MRCSCVILNYADSNRSVNLANVLSSYQAVARVVVVDNCSPDNSWENLQELEGNEKVILIRSEANNGYGAGNNIGIRYCLSNPLVQEQQLVLLCNPDTMISAEAVEETIECFLQNPNTIVASPWEYDMNTKEPYHSTAWHAPSRATYILQFLAILGRIKKIIPCSDSELTERFAKVDCISGALLMFDAEKFQSIGLYDEGIFLFCEETTVGIRSKGKFDSYICTKERYYHEFSASIRTSLPNFRKRTKILSDSRRHVIKTIYEAKGISSVMTDLCYFISLAEAWPLAWAYNALCFYREHSGKN